MEPRKIEKYVRCLLESWAVHEDGDEQGVYCTLFHLLMAVCRYELMAADQRVLTTALTKKMQYFFETKFSLKERKRKTTKENLPLKPLIKEKEKKEIEKKTRPCVGDANDAKEAFRKECLAFIGQYDKQLVADFYNYNSEVNPTTGKMRWQEQRYWNTKRRLARWVKNQYSSEITAASERLKKVRGKQQPQAVTNAEREEANARLEKEIEERKAGAVSRAEWEAIKAERERRANSEER